MKKQTVIVGALILLTVAGVVVVWLYLVPMITQAATALATKQAQYDEYTARVDTLTQAKKRLAAPIGSATGLPVNIDELTNAIPPNRDYEDLLAMIENVANTAGIPAAVSVTLSPPATTGASPTVTVTPLTISTSGGYANIKTFLSLLQTTLRPVALRSVDLAPADSGDVVISINAVTYTRDVTGADATKTAVSATTPVVTPTP